MPTFKEQGPQRPQFLGSPTYSEMAFLTCIDEIWYGNTWGRSSMFLSATLPSEGIEALASPDFLETSYLRPNGLS